MVTGFETLYQVYAFLHCIFIWNNLVYKDLIAHYLKLKLWAKLQDQEYLKSRWTRVRSAWKDKRIWRTPADYSYKGIETSIYATFEHLTLAMCYHCIYNHQRFWHNLWKSKVHWIASRKNVFPISNDTLRFSKIMSYGPWSVCNWLRR
jgi:hypothetical protein